MKTRLLTTLTAVLIALSSWAYGTEIDGIYYELDSTAKTASVTYTGTNLYGSPRNPSSTAYTGSITIPAAVTYAGTTYSVTGIGGSAFEGCTSLTSITIPNSVTYIWVSAFYGCTGLTSITIPNSVTKIGSHAFRGCTGLTSITIPNSVTSISYYAFSGCTGLEDIYALRTDPAAYNCATDAFSDYSATLHVPSDSKEAYAGTEPWSNFANIVEDVWTDGVLCFSVSSEENGEVAVSGVKDKDNLGAVTIPEKMKIAGKAYSVTSIGDNAFYECTGLTSITIPASVTSIGDEAFSYCYGLTSITIPNSVTSIGDEAFYGCEGLTSITIPNSVTSIGDAAFSGCPGLTSIKVETGNTKYDSRDNCNAIIETTSNTLVVGCKATIIPNSVTSIGDAAFFGCTGLTSITIPNSVTSIGSSAFAGCIGLTSVSIPNSVTSIGHSAFYWCSGLTSVTIGNSVTSIEDYAFENCTGLTSVNIPSSVTSIGFQTFRGCTSLTSITIPDSVTSIDYTAFDYCSCVIKVFSLLDIKLSNDFKGSILRMAEKGSKLLLQMWEKGYTVYDIATEKKIEKPTISYSTTQSTVTLTIYNKLNDYEYSLDGSSTAFANSNEYTLKGLKPETDGEVYLYARVKGSNGSWIKLARSSYSTSRIFPTTLVLKKTPSTLVIDPTLIKGDAVVTYRKLTIGSWEIDVTKGTTTLTGLIPDHEYSLTYSITANGYNMETTYKNIRTSKLTMTTQQAKVISAGNVIVAAETNLNDVETGVGFEWRRTDWTSDMASNSSATVLYEGAMEGYIRNLYTGAFWKYRPYYETTGGTRYYGEWVSFDPTNTSYFEPTVHTYATIDVKNNTASVKGYAMRGTDNVAQQGFKYWKVSSNTRAFNPASNRLSSVDIPSNAKTIQATGQVMTATLTNLEYASDYACVAFVTTTEGETFYGELQTFRTGADVTGIGNVVINAEEQTDGAPTIVGYYNLQGQRIAEPQRGQLVIVRYSDGSSRKMYVR